MPRNAANRRQRMEPRPAPVLPTEYIGFVLDESSSMSSIATTIRSAFIEQIQTIRASVAETGRVTRVSMLKFNTSVPEPVYWNVDPSEVPELTTENYRPTGMTALYDAVGQMAERLQAVENADDPAVSFLIVVLSDGQENASRTYTPHNNRLATLLSELQGGGRWTVTYIGANLDLAQMQQVRQQMALDAGNVAQFQSTPIGTQGASARMSNGIRNHYERRASGSLRSSTFYAPDAPEDVTDVPVDPNVATPPAPTASTPSTATPRRTRTRTPRS